MAKEQGGPNIGNYYSEQGHTNFGDGTIDDSANDNSPWGGGYGSEGPTENQKKAWANLGALTGYNRDTILGADKNANDVFDISDAQNKLAWEEDTRRNRRKMSSDWFTQQQKLQNVAHRLTDAAGNAFNGSSLFDFWDILATKDDMDDVAILEKLRDNQENIDSQRTQTLFQSNNSRNEQAQKTENALRELYADYMAQGNNIHPDLVSGQMDPDNHTMSESDLFNTKWFDDHKQEAVSPLVTNLTRPKEITPVHGDRNTAQAANQSYRQRLYNGYYGR